MPLVYALTSSQLDALSLVLLLGVLVGLAGHIVRSKTLIIVGILIISVISLYFGIVVAKVR